MSLFSNDMRVANTAAPSFQSQANVGQYGWTGADQGHYNQLLQYVDECRKIWINLEEKITYVEGILDEVENIDAQVKYIELIANEVQKWRQEVLSSRDQVSNMYNELLPLFADFTPKYTDFTQRYDEVVQMHTEVHAANQEAHEAAEKAEIARDEARDIAEELRKGQVYRGTWNIQANARYPDVPDTNSVWDIVLNEGSLEFRFDNTTWYWGDRLLYLKDDNKFTQIEAGGSVTSVNGKKGAVTLTSADVEALPISGGYLTGRAFVDMGASAEPQIGIRRDGRVLFMADNSTVQGMYSPAFTGQTPSWLIFRDVTSGVINLGDKRSPTVVNGKDATFSYNDKKVYHEGFKPTYTPADIGALPVTSPRVTGTMDIYAPNSHLRLIENDQTPDKVWHMEVSNGNFRLVESNVKSHIDIISGGAMVLGGPTGVKGTLQVGPSATGSNLGATSIRNQMTSFVEVISPADAEHSAGSGLVFHNASSGTAGLVYQQAGGNDAYFNFISDEVRWDVRVNNKKIYHEGFYPTAANIGAVPVSDVTSSGEFGKIPKIGPSGVTEMGNAIDFHYESAKGDFNSRLNVTKNPDGTNYTLNVTGSDLAVAGNLYEKGNRVYSEGYRPTAGGIGAVASEGNGRINGSLELTGGLSTQTGVTINGTGNVQAMFGGYLRCNTDSVMSMDGKEYSFVTSKRDAHLCNNAFWNGRDWLKYEAAVESHYIVAKQGGLEHMWSNAGSDNPNQHRGKILSSHNTGYVAASSVLVPEAGNGWIVNDHELLVYQFPGGVHVKGILRRSPAVGKVNDVIVYLHANAKLPYSIFHLDRSTTTAPFGWSYFESLNFNTNAISSGGWDAQTGWIMVDFMIQFQ